MAPERVQAVNTELAIAATTSTTLTAITPRCAPAEPGNSGERIPSANRTIAQTAAAPPRM